MIDFEELEQPKLQPQLQKEKEKADKGTKGKIKKDKQGMVSTTQAFQANVSTCSATKATTEAFATPTTTGIGSPSIAMSLPMPTPFHSKGIVLNAL